MCFVCVYMEICVGGLQKEGYYYYYVNIIISFTFNESAWYKKTCEVSAVYMQELHTIDLQYVKN